MKKLFFIAALLLVTTLCSCYAPSYSSTEPTPTRPDLDLPLPEETEPYIPPVSGKWEHDPNPYDSKTILQQLPLKPSASSIRVKTRLQKPLTSFRVFLCFPKEIPKTARTFCLRKLIPFRLALTPAYPSLMPILPMRMPR